jgi:hypothetical protein
MRHCSLNASDPQSIPTATVLHSASNQVQAVADCAIAWLKTLPAAEVSRI